MSENIINLNKRLNFLNCMNLPLIIKEYEQEPITINMFNTEFGTPFGILFTALTLRYLSNPHKNTNELKVHPTSEFCSYAAHIGFFKTINNEINFGNAPGEANANQNFTPITKIDLSVYKNKDNDEIGVLIENKAKELTDILFDDSNDIKDVLVFLIREILRNIPEHSNAEEAWYSAQYWRNGMAEVAIFDNGIGIRKSLKSNMNYNSQINSDEDAIKFAMRPGISKSFSRCKKNKPRGVWDNSGYGLYMVKEITTKFGGEFGLVSGDKYFFANGNNERWGTTEYNGTAIKIKINRNRINNKDFNKKIIDEITKKAGDLAKQDSIAFSKASKSSSIWGD